MFLLPHICLFYTLRHAVICQERLRAEEVDSAPLALSNPPWVHILARFNTVTNKGTVSSASAVNDSVMNLSYASLLCHEASTWKLYQQLIAPPTSKNCFFVIFMSNLPHCWLLMLFWLFICFSSGSFLFFSIPFWETWWLCTLMWHSTWMTCCTNAFKYIIVHVLNMKYGL